MKKYFIQGTTNEVKFGDKIELDFTKDTGDGHTKYYHIDCTFIPDLLPLLLENEVIEEKDCSEEQPSTVTNSSLEDRIIELEGRVADLEKKIETNISNIAYLFNRLPEDHGHKGK